MEGQVTVELGSWAQWASAIAAIVAVIISVISGVRSARKRDMQLVHDRISLLKDTVASHAERIARTEAELEHLPTREMVMDLSTSLAEVRGEVTSVHAKFDGVASQLARIGNQVDQLVENELRGNRA